MKIVCFTKIYKSPAQTAAAARHYAWLADHAQPLQQPSLTAVGRLSLTFEKIHGRHAEPGDLPRLAAVLGDAHGTAWVSALRRAPVNVPHAFPDGTEFAEYVPVRAAALRTRLKQGHLPDRAALHAMHTLLERTAEGPAAFYKDSNPRNFLITEDGTLFTLDPDDLTLAPFGYDLAKLITTLIMTYGRLDRPVVDKALAIYNQAAEGHDARLGTTTRERLDDYIALHAVLTAPYADRHGYRHRLPIRAAQLRDCA